MLRLAAGASAATLARLLPAAWGRKPQKHAATFQNLLFAGDHPDPTILRVGSDFYMTHTSYSYAPGLVVWHSRDLVNWTPISHALPDMRDTHGEVWSPDLAEHARPGPCHRAQSGRPCSSGGADKSI